MFAIKTGTEIALRTIISTALVLNALIPTAALAKSIRDTNTARESVSTVAGINLADSLFAMQAMSELKFMLQGHETFVVDSTEDTGDGKLGDGVCDDGTGDCTLRAAIEEANTTPGRDVISFSLPGDAPYIIQPTAPLPIITDPIVIDGSTQPN